MNPGQTIALYQPTLQAIAFNILKCKADAEDMVQETFLKWLNAEQEKIQNTKAYLIKAVTNNCLSYLDTIKKKKEQCLDTIHWSEIVERFRETDFSYLDLEAELTKAFKVLQTKLGPLERAVYLLTEVFDFDYEALQLALNKKQEHCRQLLCRARKKINQESIKLNLELTKVKLLESFRNACDFGFSHELIKDLNTDITLTASSKEVKKS